LCIQGCPQTQTHDPQPPECWDHRWAPPQLLAVTRIFFFLQCWRLDSRLLGSQTLITELQPQPSFQNFKRDFCTLELQAYVIIMEVRYHLVSTICKMLSTKHFTPHPIQASEQLCKKGAMMPVVETHLRLQARGSSSQLSDTRASF
jgi:hypothetical protein